LLPTISARFPTGTAPKPYPVGQSQVASGEARRCGRRLRATSSERHESHCSRTHLMRLLPFPPPSARPIARACSLRRTRPSSFAKRRSALLPEAPPASASSGARHPRSPTIPPSRNCAPPRARPLSIVTVEPSRRASQRPTSAAREERRLIHPLRPRRPRRSRHSRRLRRLRRPHPSLCSVLSPLRSSP
jgi:hypothetical protein